MKKYRIMRYRLIPFILIISLTIVGSEWFYRRLIASETEQCWEDLSLTHTRAARDISGRLGANLQMLNLAADAIYLNADLSDEETVRLYLESVRAETGFDRIDIVFPDATILIASTGQYIPDQGEKTYDALLELGAHLSKRVPDFLTGQESIHSFSPVYSRENKPVALLCATFYCSTLAQTFVSSRYGDAALLFLVDRRDGDIVMDRRSSLPGSIYDMHDYLNSTEEDFITHIMAGDTGRISYTSPTLKETAYTVYSPVDNTDFSLVTVIGESVIFSSLYETKNILMWVGIAEVVLLVLFSVWIYLATDASMRNEIRAHDAELALLHQKERDLTQQYTAASSRKEFLEAMALNLPGGYHRCTTDHSFRLTFISHSFTQITGYTLEQAEQELDGSFLGIVAPEDQGYFLSLAPLLECSGSINCAYRIRRRDGKLRWVQDVTQYVARDGEEFYQCALVDITEQIEALHQARQEAEASSQAKSTFLFNISHDIRTPMNAIKGFCRIIEQNAQDAQLVQQTIAKLNRASDSLMMLINDVLDIARIEQGKEKLNLQPVRLNDHGENLHQIFSADMEAAGIHFTGTGDVGDDVVYCDELKLTRIIMNMLSNAMKFTPAGGSVTLGCHRLRSDGTLATYRFFVRDTGVGMHPDFQKRAFQSFEREHTSTESGISGSGLGLAIIKLLVELMGGTVDLESELGKGTELSATITFRLARQECTGDTQKQNLPDMTGKRLLLVEDNEFNREIARYILEGMHFAVEDAENGAVCLEKLRSSAPGYYDLILMDIQMPVMDGYAATMEIRNLADISLASIPIVAMTANAFSEDIRKSLDAGMDAHVGKPIDVDVLVQVLEELL